MISARQIQDELAKRRGGVGRGDRQKFEQDEVRIISGVIHGKSIASPLAVEVKNTEWSKWEQIMSPDLLHTSENELESTFEFAAPNVPESEKYSKLQRPRPGHADLEGIRKYGFEDARPVLERASARETAARVAAGAIFKAFLLQVANIKIDAQVVQFGNLRRTAKNGVQMSDLEFDQQAQKAADESKRSGETVGGVVEVRATNVLPGLGSYISAETRLDACLASALMSIQAVKAVEIGDGFDIASTPGSKAHDAIYTQETNTSAAKLSADSFIRKTNHAGGIEGGISNGEDIIARIAIKPIPSVPSGLDTVNLATGEPAHGHSQRSDVSAVYPARIVAESMMAYVLSVAITKRFGSDSVDMIKQAIKGKSKI